MNNYTIDLNIFRALVKVNHEHGDYLYFSFVARVYITAIIL